MNTNRRMFLGAGAALALPTWIGMALSEDSAATPGTDSLANAKQRAKKVGKPLLVIFTNPAAAADDAGQVWGEFFAHAAPEAWLDLSLVEVACLPAEVVADSRKPSDNGTLWAAVIETDDAGSDPRFVEEALPDVRYKRHDDDRSGPVRDRVATLSALLHAAILPDDATRQRRRAQSIASLPELMMSEDHGRLEAALDTQGPLRLADLDRFAAVLRFAEPVAVQIATPVARLDQLGLAARMRLFEQDPPGAHWSTMSNHCPPCGMGFVPAESRYFLKFFAQ